MHNNIMTAGSRDCPPMLAMRRYAQWQSRFMRYINTRPNGGALRKCILQGPYTLSTITIPGQPATDDSPVVEEQRDLETLLNISPENKAHYDAKKEATHLLLTRIGDEIYSTVDACKITHEMWITIESLQQGESLNKQDVKTINEIHAEKITKNANPLALVAAAQQYPNTYYQAPKSHKAYAPTSKQSSSTRYHATTRYKGKEIAKLITPPSESASEEDSDPEQAQRDKDMQKNLALIAKYFRKIYKPTNNNIRTSLNTRNKNVDTSLRYKNDNQTGKFGNQRAADQNAEECDDERAVLANLIANLKLDTDENKKIQKQLKKANTSLAHELQECKSALDKCKSSLEECNRTRDRCIIALQNKEIELDKYKTYQDRTTEHDILEHKLKETLGLLAQKENDIKEGLKIKAYELSVVKEKNDEVVKQSLLIKSRYEVFLKRKTRPKGLTYNGRPTFANPMYLKKAQSEKLCLYEIPYGTYDLVNIFAPDREKTLTLEQESRSELNKDLIDELESDKADFSNIYYLLLQECVSNDVICSYLRSLSDLDAYNELQCLYLHKIKECEYLVETISKQTENVSKEVYNGLLQSFSKLEKHSISLELALQQYQEQMKNDTICKQNGSTIFLKEREQYFEIQDLKAQLQDKNIAISELKKLIEKCKRKSVETKFDKPSVVRQPNALRISKPSVLGKPTPFLDSHERKCFKTTKSVTKTNVLEGLSKLVTIQILPPIARQDTSRNTNPRVSTSIGVIHRTGVSRPQLKRTQMKDKVVQNNSQVKFKKTEGNDLLTDNCGSDLYTISLQETSAPTLICFMAKASPTQAWLWHRRLSHLNFDTINLLLNKDIVNNLPKLKYVKDQLCSSWEL
ncbi:retrovirus-related pol polyprotein from transposon TNT 1-94, partial [Tanacetum coccineum]